MLGPYLLDKHVRTYSYRGNLDGIAILRKRNDDILQMWPRLDVCLQGLTSEILRGIKAERILLGFFAEPAHAPV